MRLGEFRLCGPARRVTMDRPLALPKGGLIVRRFTGVGFHALSLPPVRPGRVGLAVCRDRPRGTAVRRRGTASPGENRRAGDSHPAALDDLAGGGLARAAAALQGGPRLPRTEVRAPPAPGALPRGRPL